MIEKQLHRTKVLGALGDQRGLDSCIERTRKAGSRAPYTLIRSDYRCVSHSAWIASRSAPSPMTSIAVRASAFAARSAVCSP